MNNSAASSGVSQRTETFGAGMGVLQKTCGAVTGGIMAIGAKYFGETDIPGSKGA